MESLYRLRYPDPPFDKLRKDIKNLYIKVRRLKWNRIRIHAINLNNARHGNGMKVQRSGRSQYRIVFENVEGL
jgi:hypothetical protein